MNDQQFALIMESLERIIVELQQLNDKVTDIQNTEVQVKLT